MAHVGDDQISPANGQSEVYAALLASEEAKHTGRGGRRVLVGGAMQVVSDPGPLLSALRAGLPVTSDHWRVPRWARDRVENKRVVVHPDGRVVHAE